MSTFHRKRPNLFRVAIGEAIEWFRNGAIEDYVMAQDRGFIPLRSRSRLRRSEHPDRTAECPSDGTTRRAQ
jgi:hypothetical protein